MSVGSKGNEKKVQARKTVLKNTRTLVAMAIPTLSLTPKGQDKVTRPELSNRPKNDLVRIKS